MLYELKSWFCRYFVLFFLSISTFSRSQQFFLLFSLIHFPSIIFWSMQRQFMQSIGKYSQTPKGPFYKNFQFRETKNFRRKIAIPPLMHKIFRKHNFLEAQKFPLTIFFGILRQKRFEEKGDAPFNRSFLITETFRSTKRDPLTKTFLKTKIFCDNSPFIPPKTSQATKGQQEKLSEASDNFKNTKRPQYYLSGTARQKIFDFLMITSDAVLTFSLLTNK